MSDHLARDVRALKLYAVVSTIALVVLVTGAFVRAPQRAKFTEIDVERINVVEPDGRYRMVIANRPRSIGPVYKGKPFGYAGGGRPGIIFFNDEGTENGGLTFTGARDSTGRVAASSHFSFDQFNQDQILYFNYNEQGGRRQTGLTIADRAPVDIYDLVQARDSIVRTVRDSAQQRAALAALTAPRNGEPMFAQRVFLGRQPDKAAVLTLTDPAGRARIRMRVDSLGTASLEFLDATGTVTARVPDRR
jgi:hypothetical protein